MITYQIDRKALHKLNTEIREMSPVLAEISPTLQTLLDMVSRHASTINTPAINEFRNDMQDVLTKAIGMTRAIVEDTQKMVSVSEQAGKHLAAIEEHFGTTLRDIPRTVNEEIDKAKTIAEIEKDL